MLKNYEEIKDKLIIKLTNKDEMVAKSEQFPTRMIEDMVVSYMIEMNDMEYGVVITNSMLKMWRITEDTLFEDALESTKKRFPAKLLTLEEMLGFSFGGPSSMYILTNSSGIYGASTLLYDGMLKKIRDEVFQNGFWILPSSIHEVILLEKKNLYQADELQRMVIEINGSIVKPNEKLSDSVYYFDENLVKVDRREELIRDVV